MRENEVMKYRQVERETDRKTETDVQKEKDWKEERQTDCFQNGTAVSH